MLTLPNTFKFLAASSNLSSDLSKATKISLTKNLLAFYNYYSLNLLVSPLNSETTLVNI